MYPSDTTYIHNYTVNDDQRVFIHFLPLEESIPGYKYNVKLIQIEDILTKDIIPLTEETATVLVMTVLMSSSCGLQEII